MYPAIGLPKCEPDFEEDLQNFIDKHITLWQSSSIGTPILAVTYTAADQRANEREASLMIDSMDKDLRNYPGREPQQSAWRERMFASLRQFSMRVFRFPQSQCDIIFSREYLATTKSFIQRGRAFDPEMETEALAQALRNVWVMNCLQLFLGRQPSLSPSIFAYSMLYPYTDNYLDRPNLYIRSKEMACRRLGLRLSGHAIVPGDPLEAAVFRLVEMIEGEFPRNLFPEVYLSLLAINSGQVHSLRQQQRSGILDEPHLLRISVAKGGSSVLADGWLVGGNLDRKEADFFFGYGVVLQLLDDLQDLTEDRDAGHWTLFTSAAMSEHLDCLTNRLWAFMHRVLNVDDCFTGHRAVELKDLIRRNSVMLMLRGMAECAGLYSSDYVHHMERLSPLSFAFMRDHSKEVRTRFGKIWPRLARRRKLRSIFDLMGIG